MHPFYAFCLTHRVCMEQRVYVIGKTSIKANWVLSAQADNFQRTGGKLRRKMWFQNMKVKLIVLAIIIVIIIIIWLSICRGFVCHSGSSSPSTGGRRLLAYMPPAGRRLLAYMPPEILNWILNIFSLTISYLRTWWLLTPLHMQWSI